MAELASLGVEIHGDGIAKTTGDLNKFASASKAAATAAAATTKAAYVQAQADEAATKASQSATKEEIASASAKRAVTKAAYEAARAEQAQANAATANSRAAQVAQRAQEQAAKAEHVARIQAATDAAAQAREITNLRAKYNPLFAEVQRYKTAQNEIRNAHRMGAISADEMSAAISRERSSSLASIAVIKNRTKAIEVMGRSSRNFNTANIAAQFQDIGVTAFMPGVSPLQIALQQGTQLSAIFEQMKASGQSMGAALVTAFRSVISPMSLVTIGAIALVAAVIQYGMEWLNSSEKSAEKLKEQKELISAVAQAWGDALPAVKAYNEEATKAKSIEDAAAATKAFVGIQYDPVKSGMDQLRIDLAGVTNDLRLAGEESNKITSLQLAVSAFAQTVADGNATVQDATNIQSALGDVILKNSPSIETMTETLKGLIEELKKAAPAAEKAKDQFDDLKSTIETIAQLSSNPGFGLNALNQFQNSPFQTDEEMKAWTDEREKQLAVEQQMADVTADLLRQNQKGSDISWADEQAAAAEKAEKAETKLKSAFDITVEGLSDRNAQMRVELQTLGDASEAAEVLRIETEAINKASKEGEELTGKQIEKIRELAREYAQLAVAAREAGLANDLAFDREQITRTPIEREVASAMRQTYGNDYKNYMNSANAEAIRFNNNLEEQQEHFEDIGKTIKSSIGDALYEAFTGGIRNADDFFEFIARAFAKLASDNLQKVVDNFTNLFSGGKSGSSAGITIQLKAAPVAASSNGAGVLAKVIPDAIKMGFDEGLGPRSGTFFSGVVPKMSDNVGRLAAAIKTMESGGRYNAIAQLNGQDYVHPKYGRAMGAYQVMEANIPSWTKEALGKTISSVNYLASREIQDRTAQAKIAQYYEKYGNAADVFSKWHSGSTLAAAQARGAGDALGTRTVDYVKKGLSLMGQPLGNAVEKGAAAGTSEGIYDAWAGLREVNQSSATNPQPAKQGGGMSLMGGLSAGLGGFSMGYQSQSPIMGALGGAMQGMAAGPWGAVIGGIAGLLGGIFGAKKKLEQAKKALEKQMKQIDALLAVGEGKGVGNLQKRLTDYLSEVDKAVDLAWKARDMALVQRLQESYNLFFIRLNKDFQAGYSGMMEAYMSGMGSDSPFLQGANAMSELREELRNWQADVKFFNDTLIDSTIKNNQGAEATAAATAVAVKQQEEARQGAIKTALAFLAGLKPMTDTTKAYYGLQGAASTLIQTLEELGYSAAEAATAVDQELNKALDKLRTDFVKNLNSEINDLSDKGYINEIRDLVDRQKDLMADAALIGVDPSIVGRWFKAAAQSVIDGAELTGPEFDSLVAAFPELAGTVHSFVEGVRSSADRLKDYEERLFAATNDTSTKAGALAEFERNAAKDRAAEIASGGEHMLELERTLAAERLKIMRDFEEQAMARRLGYQNRQFAATNDSSTLNGQLAAFDRQAQQDRIDEIKAGGEAIKDLDRALAAERAQIIRDYNKQIIEDQKRALEEAKDFLEGWFRSLKEYVDDLKAGSESPLDPAARFAAAQGQFNEQYAKALTGDRDAANSLTQYASNLLDSARERFASSGDFQMVWNDIIAKLEAIPDQVSAEQFIVDEITQAIETGTGAVVGATNVMKDTIKDALVAGVADTSAALVLYFEQLDTSVNGLLTFEEFSAGLSGVASNEELRRIFDEIDLNGDANVSLLESMLAAEGLTRTILQQAITAGPAAIAGTLATHFNKLDTSINGLLDFNEMKSALGGVASDDDIRKLIAQIDTDNDGQLSQLELIKAASQGTQTNLDSNTGVIRQLADMRAIIQEKLTGTNSLLIDQTSRMMAVLNSSNIRAGGPGGFMSGGFTGWGSASSVAGVVHGREYVVDAGTTARIGVGNLDAMRRGGSLYRQGGVDLSPVAAAIASLNARLAAIEAAVNNNTAITSQGNSQIASNTGETAKNTKTTRINTRMEADRPRQPGTNRRTVNG